MDPSFILLLKIKNLMRIFYDFYKHFNLRKTFYLLLTYSFIIINYLIFLIFKPYYYQNPYYMIVNSYVY